MAMIKVGLHITGTTTLLMHADTLADPLRPETKDFRKVTSKRTKTDDDYEEMSRFEYLAGLYLNTDGRIVIPARNVMRCLIEGARITKSGPKVERGLIVLDTDFPLQYDGPVEPGALYADKRFVSRMTISVMKKRTVRCRPKFSQWAVDVELMIDSKVLSVDELRDIATDAGSMIGLGDYRKGGGFGRFKAEIIEE
jgi:hypothetical protein